MRSLLTFGVITLLSFASPHGSLAAEKSVKAKSPSGYQLLVLAKSSGTVAKSTTAGNTTVTMPAGTKGRAYLVNASTGTLGANVVLAVKKGSTIYTWKEAKAKRACRGNARAIYGFNVKGSRLALGTIKLKGSEGWAYLNGTLPKANLDTTAVGTIDSSCTPTGTAATLGYGTSTAQSIKKKNRVVVRAESEDSDKDGLANVLDADDDDDGVIDSYDPDTTFSPPTPGTIPTTFKLFSNIKPEIQSSLNAYTTTLSDSLIDTLVTRSNLAIQVAGGSTLATELDCGALSYCNSGGTGSASGQPFPANFDADSDGKGTISPGGTGDFQLTTNTTKNDINAGDVLIQEVLGSDGSTTKVAGMLTFIFNTTPAVASLTMGSTTVAPVYPTAEGMTGSANNPFIAPSGWDKTLVLTAYRPQRPGISGAGEGTYVDIGNSQISIDIPNTPCTGGGGCSGMNTTRCSSSSYTESDSNLELSGESIKDTRADQDTDTANPTANQVTFTVNLASCISESWDSGEKLAIDLQFSNSVGDNAAQKFYIQLP